MHPEKKKSKNIPVIAVGYEKKSKTASKINSVSQD